MRLSKSPPTLNYLVGSMEQSSKVNDTSTKTPLAMPHSFVTATPNTSGTESLLVSSHLTKDTLVKHEAQEAIPSSIPSTSSGLDEESRTSSTNGESQEYEDASSIYHDAAESIRSSSSIQTAFLVGPTYPDAVESTPSSSVSQRAVSVNPEFSTAEYSSDDNLEDDNSEVNSEANSSLMTLRDSRHLDSQVYDLSARTSIENPTISSTHFVGVSSPELNVEKSTSEFDVQITTVESDNMGLMQLGSAEQGFGPQQTIDNDASLPRSVASARSNHDRNDGSQRKMNIFRRIKAFLNPLKQPKQPKIFFHLIRHGVAYHNLGHERGLNSESFAIIDPSLTQLGVQQALSLKHLISTTHPTPTLILISPLVRAIETALLVYPPGETATSTTKPQYIAWDDVRECGNHPCNKRGDLHGLRKRYAGRGLDLRALSEEAPATAGDDVWARVTKVQHEFVRIAEMLKRGGGSWKGVELRRGSEAGKDIHVAVVSHGSFLKRLLGINSGAEIRLQFAPTELRSCELNAKGSLVETRESLKLRQARRIMTGL